MHEVLSGLTVVAAEGIPADSPLAKLAVPLGALVFLGLPYLLLRSNLGTRRAYLVLATSFFGFMIIVSLFWTFGAPGTPQAVGPSYLPGQPRDAYEAKWVPFAKDSLVAEREEYSVVQNYPDAFGEVPEDFSGQAQNGAEAVAGFFADEDSDIEHEPVDGFSEDWKVDQIRYAEADNGFPVIAVTYLETGDDGEEVVDDPEEVTLFGFFDGGAILFPGLVVAGLAVLGFAIHALLLAADENRQRREEAEAAQHEEERVPAGA